MPIEWLRDLHQAAILGDADLIITLAEEILESNSDLSQILIDYVNQFQFEDITDLTEKIIQQEYKGASQF